MTPNIMTNSKATGILVRCINSCDCNSCMFCEENYFTK